MGPSVNFNWVGVSAVCRSSPTVRSAVRLPFVRSHALLTLVSTSTIMSFIITLLVFQCGQPGVSLAFLENVELAGQLPPWSPVAAQLHSLSGDGIDCEVIEVF